ncbi:hypothetical protein JX265_009351 [Neoarthrinium moseri]|uniref:Uncharacterized protein n=1 Tax=Neoarthrinium moseri TaxID=1658444 RepID=A0A9Q0ALN0_9PEZI|nr:hypothetical protein JX265_009351 [Neoarthrinium moseri]
MQIKVLCYSVLATFAVAQDLPSSDSTSIDTTAETIMNPSKATSTPILTSPVSPTTSGPSTSIPDIVWTSNTTPDDQWNPSTFTLFPTATSVDVSASTNTDVATSIPSSTIEPTRTTSRSIATTNTKKKHTRKPKPTPTPTPEPKGCAVCCESILDKEQRRCEWLPRETPVPDRFPQFSDPCKPSGLTIFKICF